MSTCDHVIDGQTALATPENGQSADVICAALQSAIDDTQSFLTDFCERLQNCLVQDSADLESQYETFGLADDQEHWDSKRTELEQRIRQQVDMLAEAWLRLEAEQRDFLQLKEGLAIDRASRTVKRSTEAESGNAQGNLSGDAMPLSRPQQTVVDEFERMRREIQSSRPNNRVKRD